MATVQFRVEVKHAVITAGTYAVQGIVEGDAGPAGSRGTFTGQSFNAVLDESGAAYFAVTVFVEEYELGGVAYTVTDYPITLLATLYLPGVDYTVVVSPESSVASLYTFARMTVVDADGLVRMRGTARHAKIAYGMKQNLYETQGVVAEMIKASPNGFETNSYPMFNSLCNLLYYCMANPVAETGQGFYAQFLEAAWHEAGKPNTSFLGALRNLLYDPFTGAREIYLLLKDRPEIYADSLVSMKVAAEKKAPHQWTLTLKSNSSGSKNFIPSGAAFVVFDRDDNAWIANNFRAGSGLSGTHCPVYKYNAQPADFSPVQGGGLLGVGFGVAISPDKRYISFGNFGWGPVLNNPQEGSIARFFYKDGKPMSPSNGYTPGLSRVQGMNYDAAGNLWMASVGCQDPFAPAPTGVYPFESVPSAVVVYLDGEPTEGHVVILDEFPVKRTALEAATPRRTPYLKIFDVVPDNQGNAYVSCIGHYDRDDLNKCALSAVYKVTLQGKALTVVGSWFSEFEKDNQPSAETGYESLRQLALNQNGDVVVVGVKSSRATVLSNDLTQVLGYYDVNTYAPWGVKIDQQQTVFLANFGHESNPVSDSTLDNPGPFGVTMLRDASNPGSARLMTVPSGGQEVMLANGFPLYGTQTKPVIVDGKPKMVLVDGEPQVETVRMQCFEPIMRLTSTNIDGAGNLWCMNNWKPSAAVDVLDNPGGDGVVIFLGIAEPE